MSCSGGGTCAESGWTAKKLVPFGRLNKLVGTTLTEFWRVKSDEGVKLVFSDGSILEVGYSECYGGIRLNGEEMEASGL